MDTRTRNTIGSVELSTLNIARRVLAHLDTIGRPLPAHPDTGYPVIWGRGGSSEHATGRALDFMVTADTEIGNLIAEYVWDRRDEFGLIHVIWRQHIRSTKVSPGINRSMEDRGSPTENHMDHTHVFFDGRAVDPPSGSGADSTPKPTESDIKKVQGPVFPLPRGWYFGPKSGPRESVSGYYSHRDDLKTWQRRMSKRGWVITIDGLYGHQTHRVASQFQREKGLTVDGLIGVETWRAAWTKDIT